jgi:putative ABC transport system permease protein
MILHYFKIALRYLLKQRLLTAINILGLTVGITVSLLIFLYVRYDQNYDRYNVKAERIYRIGLHGKMGDTEFTQTHTTSQLAQELVNTCPEIEAVVRMLGSKFYVKSEEGSERDPVLLDIMTADSSLLDVFTLNILAGDPRTALKEPGTVILME